MNVANKRIEDALSIAFNFGLFTDGAHHKQWAIDQIVRALLGEETTEIRAEYRLDLTKVDSYADLHAVWGWDEGIAP